MYVCSMIRDELMVKGEVENSKMMGKEGCCTFILGRAGKKDKQKFT